MSQRVAIGHVTVVPDLVWRHLPIAVCAEISCNHAGSFDRALKLIGRAKWAGADLVKFQAFTLEEILKLRGGGQAKPPWDRFSNEELYAQAETPLQWLPKMFARAAEVGIVAFSSVFGYDSLAALERLNCPAYKIAKSDNTARWLVDAALSTQKPVLMSLGRDDRSMDLGDNRTLEVYCADGYPTTEQNVRLAHLRGNGQAANYVGLSCHSLDPLVPPMAVALGARYLEYHLMLEAADYIDGLARTSPPELPLDAAFSHTPESFKAMVESVRAAERILG